MPRRLMVQLLTLAAVATGFTPADAGNPLAAQQPRPLPDIVAPLLPAVVNITVLRQPSGTVPQGAQDMPKPVTGLGSGFIIDADGYIVTNRHVVAGGYSITVVLNDERAYKARVLATNERPDLALLKIEAGHTLPTVAFGDSDALRVGEPVVAIGNPLGLSSSVSVGVVSALNRNLNSTMIDDFVQTDAAINEGNSGGPLFNLKGQVVGVSWALVTPGSASGSAGLGLAIPSRDAAWVIGQMRRYGRVHAGFLGVRVQEVTPDMADVLGLPEPNPGGIIAGIWPGGPADQAGMREGDVILAFNHWEPHDVRALLRAMGSSPPGQPVPAVIWRDGRTETVQVTLTDWRDPRDDPAGAPVAVDRGDRQRSPDLGLHMASTDAAAVRTIQLPDGRTDVTVHGVTVVGVAANSAAADAGFAAGDVILRVMNAPVATPADVTSALEAARADGRKAVMMLVLTDNRTHWVVVPIHEG